MLIFSSVVSKMDTIFFLKKKQKGDPFGDRSAGLRLIKSHARFLLTLKTHQILHT